MSFKNLFTLTFCQVTRLRLVEELLQEPCYCGIYEKEKLEESLNIQKIIFIKPINFSVDSERRRN